MKIPTAELGSTTPVVFVLFLTALFGSFIFMSFNQPKYQYAGDYPFVFKKFAMMLAIIALGFFVTLLFPLVAKFPFGGQRMHAIIETAFGVAAPVVRCLSVVWFVVAAALLPFGHSVINTDTRAVDKARTDQVASFYSAFYEVPYYVLYIVFGIVLVFTAVAMGEAYNDDGGAGEQSFAKVIQASYTDIRSTVGFYFYHPKNATVSDADAADADAGAYAEQAEAD